MFPFESLILIWWCISLCNVHCSMYHRMWVSITSEAWSFRTKLIRKVRLVLFHLKDFHSHWNQVSTTKKNVIILNDSLRFALHWITSKLPEKAPFLRSTFSCVRKNNTANGRSDLDVYMLKIQVCMGSIHNLDESDKWVGKIDCSSLDDECPTPVIIIIFYEVSILYFCRNVKYARFWFLRRMDGNIIWETHATIKMRLICW